MNKLSIKSSEATSGDQSINAYMLTAFFDPQDSHSIVSNPPTFLINTITSFCDNQQ